METRRCVGYCNDCSGSLYKGDGRYVTRYGRRFLVCRNAAACEARELEWELARVAALVQRLRAPQAQLDAQAAHRAAMMDDEHRALLLTPGGTEGDW